MDRRRIELQIRTVLLTYRIELRRHDSPTMQAFRERAHSLLDAVEKDVGPEPDLRAALLAARDELDLQVPSARGALGEEPLDGSR